ncbi:MAG: alpha/beta hydrolase [Burkholderiales bacterium]|nr:alpha/beta hydrolase [Burkholderiales bacterium]
MSKQRVESIIDQGVHRFLADGVHYRDLLDIRAAIPAWPQWPEVWSRFAAAAEGRGVDALAKSLTRTAATELARAALYYHYAQNLFYDDERIKRATHDRKVAAFARAAPLLDPPLERVEIAFDGIMLPGYLRVPRGVRKPACVILLGGLDTTKEDYLGVNDLCAARGLATLAFDGPGQGETLFRMRWRADFERSIAAVLDYLETRSEIDSARIGIIGRSTGGFYAPKIAALDARIRAAVAWGAMYHLRNLATIPEVTREGFVYVCGSRDVGAALEFFRCIDLEGFAGRITCPLMVVHGGLDTITPIDNAKRLMAEARGPVEALIWDDSGHCCHDRAHIVRPAMADFMLRRL